MLVQVHEASCVLKDRLEEIRRFSFQLPALPKPADTPQDERYISLPFLPELLHFELEQIGFWTAHSRCFFAVSFVKGLAAFVELLDCRLTFGLVVSVASETVWHKRG
jgi:hypothetical protein